MSKAFFDENTYRLTLRFVQGYRFLDRCGEALVKLEEALHKDWIPTEATPKGGAVRNDTLGMVAAFNSEHVTIQQSEFLSFETFRDQTCTLVDVLRSTFQIERFVGPAVAVIFQRQFKDGDVETPDRILREMNLMTSSPKLQAAIGGDPAGVTFALVTQAGQEWHGVPVKLFRRIEGRVVRQVAAQPFDERLLRRAGFLPEKQRNALLGLQRLRDMHPTRASVAIEINLETFLEGEIDKSELNVYDFLTEVHQWATTVLAHITTS